MGKHYDLEYKMQIAKLVVEEGKKAAELARDLDIPIGTLRNWIDAYRKKKESGFVGSGNLAPDVKVVKDLEKQIRDLQEENEILKKAMHVFTKNPN
jgi:transposase